MDSETTLALSKVCACRGAVTPIGYMLRVRTRRPEPPPRVEKMQVDQRMDEG